MSPQAGSSLWTGLIFMSLPVFVFFVVVISAFAPGRTLNELSLPLNKEVSSKTSMGNSLVKILSSVTFLLLFLNMLGLIPYSFPTTSCALLVVFLSITGFLMIVSSAIRKDVLAFIGSLLPSGTPLALIIFIPFLELISIIIRPITLSLRLLANILTGHVVMSLISSGLTKAGLISVPFIALTSWHFFELFVALIQTLVFFLLLKSYSEEHCSNSMLLHLNVNQKIMWVMPQLSPSLGYIFTSFTWLILFCALCSLWSDSPWSIRPSKANGLDLKQFSLL